MKLWEYLVLFDGAIGFESGETIASSKSAAEGNVREYFCQYGQIHSVVITKINRR